MSPMARTASRMTALQGDRLTVVDALRGLAALAVAWFHFTNGNTAFLPDG